MRPIYIFPFFLAITIYTPTLLLPQFLAFAEPTGTLNDSHSTSQVPVSSLNCPFFPCYGPDEPVDHPVRPEEADLIRTVSGFYGPGAVGGWILSCLSFMLSHLLPEDDIHDQLLNNDFIVTMLYPFIASCDLVSQWIRLRPIRAQLGIWNELSDWRRAGLWHRNPGPWHKFIKDAQWMSIAGLRYWVPLLPSSEVPAEVWALPYSAFASLTIIRISLIIFCIFFVLTTYCFVDFKSVRYRTIVALLVMGFSIIAPMISVSQGWKSYAYYQNEIKRAYPNLLPQGNVFTFLRYRLATRFVIFSDMGLVLALSISTIIILARSHWPLLFKSLFTILAGTCVSNVLFGLRLQNLGSESLALSWDPSMGSEWQPAFLMENRLLPQTASKLGDLDQAVACLAGASATLITLHEIIIKRGYWADLKNRMHNDLDPAVRRLYDQVKQTIFPTFLFRDRSC